MYYFSSVKAVCAALSEEESSLLLFSIMFFLEDTTNRFYPVFIKRLHDKANSVIGTYFISDFREAIQMFDDKSAEGIVIFGYKIRFQTVVYIVQIHRSFDDIFLFGNLSEHIVLFFVVFVMNLAYDFFQNIFQCDQSCLRHIRQGQWRC